MMRQPIVQDDLAALLAGGEAPCLSLYQATHRRHPDNAQDPVRYKNLLKELESSLLQRHPSRESEALLNPFRQLASDQEFWRHTWDGLAIFGSASQFRYFRLQRPVEDLAIVAKSFHIKPLLRGLQSVDRYHVLCLNRRDVKLFEGSRHQLDEVELAPGVPRTITEALGEELSEPHVTVASHGGVALGSSMRHGHGSKPDETEIDEERFFRAVDRAILEHYSRPSGLPLMLAALPQYHTPFRKLSHNPLLMSAGVEVDASALTPDQLRDRAWTVVEPDFKARLSKQVEAFEEARAKGLGTDKLREVAEAAAASRVGTLLIQEDRRIPGHLDPSTGRVTEHSLDDPQIDDLLDDLGELVLQRGGTVMVIPGADMPVTTGVAATFRF